MKRISTPSTSTCISSITELGLTGELLSINTKYPDNGFLDLDTSTGVGMSGMWVIAEYRIFDYVVLRVLQHSSMYKVYTGRFLGLNPTTGNEKKIVIFDQLKFAGISDTKSLHFNEGKPSGHGKTYVTVADKHETDESQSPEDPQNFREGSEIIGISRPDQSLFAKAVRKNCKNRCVITGSTMQWRNEAAHLIPHRDKGIPDVTNGLLMRRDIHALFDQGHCAINPENMIMFFSLESRRQDEDLNAFHSTLIGMDKLEKPINKKYLMPRWVAFLNKHGTR